MFFFLSIAIHFSLFETQHFYNPLTSLTCREKEMWKWKFCDILQLPSEINDPRCICISSSFSSIMLRLMAYGIGEVKEHYHHTFSSTIHHAKIFLPYTLWVAFSFEKWEEKESHIDLESNPGLVGAGCASLELTMVFTFHRLWNSCTAYSISTVLSEYVVTVCIVNSEQWKVRKLQSVNWSNHLIIFKIMFLCTLPIRLVRYLITENTISHHIRTKII